MKLIVSLVSVLFYCTVLTLLTYTNTAYFHVGESDYGAVGRIFSWYAWAILFLPIFLFGIVLNWLKNDPIKEYAKCNLVLTILVSVFIEISFVFNLSWQLIILEYGVIAIIWIYILKLKQFLTRRYR